MTSPYVWTNPEPADVLALTGAAVTDDQISMAQSIIEMAAGLDFTYVDPSLLRPQDVTWLTRAIIYQVAWMLAQPDFFFRTNLSELRQEGLLLKPMTDQSLLLAPLASRAISRLSWKKTRSTEVLTSLETSYPPILPPNAPIRDYPGGDEWEIDSE